MSNSWNEERHRVFKEEAYPLASLPKAEFEEAFEEFKAEHANLLLNESKPRVHFTKSQLRNFIKNFKF